MVGKLGCWIRMWLLFLIALACILDGVPARSAASPSLDEVNTLLAKGAYAEAESSARKLLEIQEHTAPEDTKGRIEILLVLVQTLDRLGKDKRPETLDLAKEAGFTGPYTLIYDSSGGDEWKGLAIERDLVAPYL